MNFLEQPFKPELVGFVYLPILKQYIIQREKFELKLVCLEFAENPKYLIKAYPSPLSKKEFIGVKSIKLQGFTTVNSYYTLFSSEVFAKRKDFYNILEKYGYLAELTRTYRNLVIDSLDL